MLFIYLQKVKNQVHLKGCSFHDNFHKIPSVAFPAKSFSANPKTKGLTLQARGYWGPKKSFFRAFTFEWPGPRLRETFQQISSSTTFPRHLGMSCPSTTNIISRKNIIKIRLQGRRQRPFERHSGVFWSLWIFFFNKSLFNLEILKSRTMNILFRSVVMSKLVVTFKSN